MRRLATLIITLILASSAARPVNGAEPTRFPDFRQPVDRTSAGFRQLNAIGTISANNVPHVGTGFLVSPCLVLTNKHVAFKDVLSAAIGLRLLFSVGQGPTPDIPFLQQIPGKVVAFSDYNGTLNNLGGDWALIKLDHSISGIPALPIVAMSETELRNRPAMTAGFPGDKRSNLLDVHQMWGDLDCQVIGESDGDYLLHNCQTTPGQSGSPILVRDQNDDRLVAVGIVHGGNFDLARYTDINRANHAVSFVSGDGMYFSPGDQIFSAIAHERCN